MTGVEIVRPAVEDANASATRNGITNVSFICGDASTAVSELEKRRERPDVVTIDPPRKGLTPDCIASILRMQPSRIVYVSCDPATLARDLSLLCKDSYALERCEVFDMFPCSSHCEVVTLITRAGV